MSDPPLPAAVPVPDGPPPVRAPPGAAAGDAPSGGRARWAFAALGTIAGAVVSWSVFDDPERQRAGTLAAACLALWLAEVVPPFLPTLLLLAATPLALGPPLSDAGLEPRVVLGWMADPVLALFFGGFVLGEAARLHGLDRALVGAAIQRAHGRPRRILAGVVAMTAFLSMWMSNIAAAALMIACARPLCDATPRLRRVLLVAVALAANLGGMATPIGTGPNAIAIAAMAEPIPFAAWMLFAVPLVAGCLVFAVALLLALHRVDPAADAPTLEVPDAPEAQEVPLRPALVGMLAVAAIVAWVSEPLHGVGAPVVSLLLAVALFSTGLVPASGLRRVDWSTLILIAGGIGLGRLFEATHLLDPAVHALAGASLPALVRLAALLVASAALSSLMSNTGTAALLVPLAGALLPEVPTAPVLVALAASFGMPFVVSTPPNAMAVGAGATARDLLVPGLVLMALGCALLALTGPTVLGLFGVG